MQRRHRLRSTSDFSRLHKHGRRFHHSLLVLVVCKNDGPVSRFGFSASRQVGKAIRRNRAKRLMRESVRQYQDQIPSGWDCLFIAKTPVAEATLDQVIDGVGQLLQRAGLLTD